MNFGALLPDAVPLPAADVGGAEPLGADLLPVGEAEGGVPPGGIVEPGAPPKGACGGGGEPVAPGVGPRPDEVGGAELPVPPGVLGCAPGEDVLGGAAFGEPELPVDCPLDRPVFDPDEPEGGADEGGAPAGLPPPPEPPPEPGEPPLDVGVLEDLFRAFRPPIPRRAATTAIAAPASAIRWLKFVARLSALPALP